jgi:hypothetical protein
VWTKAQRAPSRTGTHLRRWTRTRPACTTHLRTRRAKTPQCIDPKSRSQLGADLLKRPQWVHPICHGISGRRHASPPNSAALRKKVKWRRTLLGFDAVQVHDHEANATALFLVQTQAVQVRAGMLAHGTHRVLGHTDGAQVGHRDQQTFCDLGQYFTERMRPHVPAKARFSLLPVPPAPAAAAIRGVRGRTAP